MSFVHLHRACVLLALLITASVTANDWPQWRGPNRNGTTTEADWLRQWPDQGPPIAWKAKVGLGYSSFVVADGRAFTAGHDNAQDTVFCFDAASGAPQWKHSYPAELGDKYFQGGTTGTPTFSEGKLYWLSRWGDLFSFDAASGRVIWSKNIQKETGLPIPDWGFAGAPLVYGDLLILNMGDAGLAVNKNSGGVVWTSAKKDSGYSTPLPFQDNGRTLVALSSGRYYLAVEPETGKEAWRIRWVTQYGVNGADPIITENRIFLSTGYGKGAGLFDRSNPEKEIWSSKVLRTQQNAAVLYNGYVYGADGDAGAHAKLKCIELATGDEKWAEPNFGTGGLIIADGQIIALSERGELMVAPAAPAGFNPSARAQILGGLSWTAPVLANGRVYCRNSRGDVACVDLRKQP